MLRRKFLAMVLAFGGLLASTGAARAQSIGITGFTFPGSTLVPHVSWLEVELDEIFCILLDGSDYRTSTIASFNVADSGSVTCSFSSGTFAQGDPVWAFGYYHGNLVIQSQAATVPPLP